jgi:hypothetical protein
MTPDQICPGFIIELAELAIYKSCEMGELTRFSDSPAHRLNALSIARLARVRLDHRLGRVNYHLNIIVRLFRKLVKQSLKRSLVISTFDQQNEISSSPNLISVARGGVLGPTVACT